MGCQLPKGGGRPRKERKVAKGLCEGGRPIAKGGESERGTGRGGEEGRLECLERAASTLPLTAEAAGAVSVAVEAVWPVGSIYDGWRSGGNKRSEISRVSGRKPKACYSCVLEFSTRASNIANHIYPRVVPKAL